jgi:hypothetical protein
MEVIKGKVGFWPAPFRTSSATSTGSDQFKYPNTDEGRQRYLADAKAFIDQVMAGLAPLFPAPAQGAAGSAGGGAVPPGHRPPVAFYNRPRRRTARARHLYVNLADMTPGAEAQIEAISYHEGAPGITSRARSAQELPNVPKFRRFGGYTAYGEGWGPLCRAARQGDGLLPGSLFGFRPPLDRAVARDPAGGRHRHPPQEVDPRAGDRIFRSERPAVAPRRDQGGRALLSTIRGRRPAT